MPPLVRPAPPRSACFQPNNYTSLELFANRHDLLEDLLGTLESYLDPDGPGEAYLLLRGTRGFGKSMLARKALSELNKRYAVLTAEVDCAVTGTNPEAVLRAIARSLVREVVNNVHENKDGLRKGSELFDRMTRATELKGKEVQSWTSQIKLSVGAAPKLYDTIAMELGMARVAGRSKEIEENYQRKVDAPLLLDLIGAFLLDCQAAGEKVLVFVDNLDQVGYPERKEDFEAIMDLARHLFGLKRCVVLATLRSEFVDRNLHKLHTLDFDVPGMSSDELMEVADKRMSGAGTRQKKALEEVSFRRIAEALSRVTDNVWAFLSWLEYLDQKASDLRGVTEVGLDEALLSSIQSLYRSLDPSELRAIGKVFSKGRSNFYKLAELETLGISRLALERAVSTYAIIPDQVVDPQGYTLAPQLHFLAVEG